MTYAWIRDGVRMSGESKRLLVLIDVSRSERGRHYACSATESRGLTSDTSSPFVLEVQCEFVVFLIIYDGEFLLLFVSLTESIVGLFALM